ncbi:RNA polymerase subunit sigma-24 [Paenibacillus sp. PR3]|uniref:RNA polymerase subunit sigma-24 n=2 Tax=Paenibacillus terricola TaxID=2763503 RepID=A0ABR8MNP3_9BACL|nr:RNA polymerase subunit sigma-24 [Paenibacillus terricola]
MHEAEAIERLRSYKRIIARLKVLENYSVGAGITVSRMNQDDHLMDLHRKLRAMPTYMYLTNREQVLETTAHAYLTDYPVGTKAQLAAIPRTAADPGDAQALREIRQKIEKVIEARTGNREGYEGVLDRLSEFQDLENERDQIDAGLEALESYKPDYAFLLRLRYVEGLEIVEVVERMQTSRRTFERSRPKALYEFSRLSM